MVISCLLSEHVCHEYSPVAISFLCGESVSSSAIQFIREILTFNHRDSHCSPISRILNTLAAYNIISMLHICITAMNFNERMCADYPCTVHKKVDLIVRLLADKSQPYLIDRHLIVFIRHERLAIALPVTVRCNREIQIETNTRASHRLLSGKIDPRINTNSD